jgi:hypothetical protein
MMRGRELDQIKFLLACTVTGHIIPIEVFSSEDCAKREKNLARYPELCWKRKEAQSDQSRKNEN